MGILKKGFLQSKYMLQKEMYWSKLFNIDKYCTKNRKFGWEITTDGKAVSILQRKPKKQEIKSEKTAKININDYNRIWGIDPGRKDLFVASDQNNNILKCSSREFYHDAKYTYCKKKIESWYKSDEKILNILRNFPSIKTSSIHKIGNFLTYMFKNIDLLLDFHRDKAFRNIKFTRFIAAKKKITQLCQKIACDGHNTLVGFGDWSNNDKIIKGYVKGPVKKLRYELTKHCRVIDIDEYKSSKLCHGCSHEIANQKWNQYDIFGMIVDHGEIHHSLRCNNVSCEMRGMNRDVNASKNILNIFTSFLTTGKRPTLFTRE